MTTSNTITITTAAAKTITVVIDGVEYKGTPEDIAALVKAMKADPSPMFPNIPAPVYPSVPYVPHVEPYVPYRVVPYAPYEPTTYPWFQPTPVYDPPYRIGTWCYASGN